MPTEQDLDALVGDGTAYVFFQSAGIREDVVVALYTHMAMEDDEHYSTLGAMTGSEVEQVLSEFAAAGNALPVLMRAQLRTAFTIARTASGHEAGAGGSTPSTSATPSDHTCELSASGPKARRYCRS